ncbi:MAG: DUF975 family protein [Atopostipes suicloacalis]|nr:DUF975 family protein [Atopostipes suicloacalis]
MIFITKKELYSSRDIKIEAKAQLKNHWKDAIFLALIPILFSIFFISEMDSDAMQMSTGRRLINLLLTLIHSFLLTSVSYSFLDFVRERTQINPLEGTLQAFKRKYFINLLLLKVIKYIYTLLWTFLLIIPGIVKGFAYAQAELIFKDRVDQTGEIPNPRECIKESVLLMDGHKLDLFALRLSFIGWYILSILTLGIPFIWVTPYIEMSQVVFYENLLENKDFSRRMREKKETSAEIGRSPDDFRDFEDF